MRSAHIPNHSLSAQKALQTLSTALSASLHPLQWWEIEFSGSPPENRRPLLNELAVILAQDMHGVSNFAKGLDINKAKHPAEFESILFDFLLPLHEALTQRSSWDEALNLELIIYSAFIKQDEDHDFYERAFAKLYSPYATALKETADPANLAHSTKTASIASSDNATLFWFQNYSILAHTQLVLDLTEFLPIEAKFYASALSNIDLQKSQSKFTQAGIEILEINDRQSLASRCNELITLCKRHGIRNIVMVSLPLQSGYLKSICDGIALTWWSMKYPLGCMPHFDRLVCNRTLYPTQKVFHGALWLCAPFALKAIVPQQLGTTVTDLKVGVLAREEKFASSQLPEILNQCLVKKPNLQIFWTGRTEDPSLVARLGGTSHLELRERIHFAGWVDPALFLSQVDLLVDTPNLGGMVAYWAMSMGKVVISATNSGSVGALGSHNELQAHFQLLTSAEEIRDYFHSESPLPYYLSSAELIPLCLIRYADQKELLKKHGQRFLHFFSDALSDMDRWSEVTYLMLTGSKIK
jgi:hypothetical protein